MSSKLLFNSAKIKIPDEMAIFTKNGKVKIVKPLKNNTIKTINKKKAILISEDKDIDNIVIESQGRKIEISDDIKLNKLFKEKKPRSKTTKPKTPKKSKSLPKNKIDKDINEYIKNFNKEKEIEEFDKLLKKKTINKIIEEVKPIEIKKEQRRKVNTKEEYDKAEEEVYKEARKLAPKLKNFIYKDIQTPEERELLKQNSKERDEFIQSYIRKNRPIYKQKEVYLN